MNQSDQAAQPHESPLNIGDAFVAICDWNGIVKWLSNSTIKTQVGDLGWSNMISADAGRFREAFALTATVHERRVIEIESLNGLRYRIWLMPIGVPEFAVCTFNLRIPCEIESLSDREREIMKLLAQGQSLKEAATSLDCSINTIHTHAKNIKGKLRLNSPSEIISFAGRFFGNSVDPLKVTESVLEPKQQPVTKKSSKKNIKKPAAKKNLRK